ncbi:MAG: dipeptidyl peptidase 3, partial [Bacteroidia bacterium]|nr:dipeptidyl peptidase 3 [Bacteroidia bacterium]
MNFKTIMMCGTVGTMLTFAACKSDNKTGMGTETEFEVNCDNFADLQVLRYQIPGFEELSLQQKELAYYLSEAANCGRDIYFDQKYKHNLSIRRTLEAILNSYGGARSGTEWEQFETYAKRVFFSNGIHHHYSNIKFIPACSPNYFNQLVRESDASLLPLDGKELEQFISDMQRVWFDPNYDAKLVNLASNVDNVAASANNFYEGVTAKEVDAYYAARIDTSDRRPISWGLNSKLVKVDGELKEIVWKVGGMYGAAIEKIVYWLEKAVTVAENDKQKKALELLVQYYKTGDLKIWDEYNIAWVNDTESRLDVVNGFIEV